MPLSLEGIKRILEQNKDKNFVQRILTPEKFPGIANPDGSYSTHITSVSSNKDKTKHRVFPQILQEKGGRLRKREVGGPAERTAYDRGEFIEFDSLEDAVEFSKRYKELWPKDGKFRGTTLQKAPTGATRDFTPQDKEDLSVALDILADTSPYTPEGEPRLIDVGTREAKERELIEAIVSAASPMGVIKPFQKLVSAEKAAQEFKRGRVWKVLMDAITGQQRLGHTKDLAAIDNLRKAGGEFGERRGREVLGAASSKLTEMAETEALNKALLDAVVERSTQAGGPREVGSILKELTGKLGEKSPAELAKIAEERDVPAKVAEWVSTLLP